MRSNLVLFLFAVFLFAAVSATRTVTRSWNGVVYFYTSSDERQPAAIQKVFDFSNLEGHALQMASQKRLLDAQFLLSDRGVGIELGHFVTRSKSGRKQFACSSYDLLELTFYSGDMAVSGEPPVMKIEGPCLRGENVNRIAPLLVPFDKIYAQKPGDMELQFLEQGSVTVSFFNVGDSWPQQWVLRSVKLRDSQTPGRHIAVDSTAIPEALEKPLGFSWRKPASN